MFGPSYVPDDADQLTEKQQMGRWAVDVVVGALDPAVRSTPASWTDSSLLREFIARTTLKSERFLPSCFLHWWPAKCGRCFRLK